MNKLTTKIALMSLLAIAMIACKSNEPVKFTEVELTITFPDYYTGTKKDIKVEFINLATQKKEVALTSAEGKATITLEEGNYNITASSMSDNKIYKYIGKIDNKNLTGLKLNLSLPFIKSIFSSSWLIKEVYFSGSKTPSDKPYWGDQYIEIYNNSSEILYADGLIFCETYDITQSPKPNWGKYLKEDKIVPTFIFQVPGTGKEHPVAPGKSIVIANQGKNHKTDNPNSPVDLSKADFEWYDKHKLDIDVAEVPNMIKHYSASKSISLLHNRGYKGYYILHIPVAETKAFLDKNPASTKMPNGSTQESFAIPVHLIIDAVQCAHKDGYKSAVFPESLDAGYTYCDDSGTGKCVQRKFLKDENGRAVLKDANNSKEDFTPNATPSPRVVVK